MSDRSLFEDLPLWLFVVLVLGLLFAAVEIGYRVGRYRHLRHKVEREEAVGAMVAAALGLVAFLLAFTFGIAVNRYDTKRQTLHDEVNTIGTTYLRTDFLTESQRGEVKKLLRDYVETRILALEPGQLAAAVQQAEELQGKLWATSLAGGAVATPHTSLFFQSLNELIDLHTKRMIAGLRSRIPDTIWLALLASMGIAFAATGYHNGTVGSCRSPLSLVIVLLFGLVVGMIMDLERPGQGTLRIDNKPMEDLRTSLK